METWISSKRGLGGDVLYLPLTGQRGSSDSLGEVGMREQDSMKEKASKHNPGIGNLWSRN